MRKFVLIAAVVLASASAQAGDRSLSLGPGTTVATVQATKAAEVAPAVETPKATVAPTYVDRPTLAQPTAQSPKAESPSAQPAKSAAKTASAPKPEKPRRKRYWTEGRIISELHRHGIYW
jgi:hypothetical protein